jgi:hypothetical protein
VSALAASIVLVLALGLALFVGMREARRRDR